jgi:purine-nucleoside/S-methyl-5'-thioadenosine phosphorylase / adenosine deaminase
VELWKEASLPRFLLAVSARGEAPPDHPSATAHLARELARALGHPALPIARATQVHGTTILEPTNEIGEGETRLAGEGDILLTRRRGLALVVQTADCVPILLIADEGVAAVHAGWRGAARGAARAAAAAMKERLGAKPEGIRAYLGPAIGPCCYEVGGEVASSFAGEFLRRECRGKFRLDLKGANRAQLEAEGVPPANITVLPLCTMCGGLRCPPLGRFSLLE